MADGALSRKAGARPSRSRREFEIVRGDALAWLRARPANTIHAIVTDPPYGLKEYSEVEKGKLRKGRGGVWRIPPSFDGCLRKPLPRFTVSG